MASKKNPISLPANLTELNERIALYGSLQRSLNEQETARDTEIAAIRAAHAPELALVAERMTIELNAIETYANANRSSILVGEQKSVSFAAGRIGWRLTPWRVTFQKGGELKAIADLKLRRLKKFLRFTVEVDKEALLKDRPAVDGVKYKQSDDFFVEPNAEPTLVEAIGEALMVTR